MPFYLVIRVTESLPSDEYLPTNVVDSLRQGFNRQNEGTGNINTSQQRSNGSPNPSPTTFAPTMPPLIQSSSTSSNTGPSSDNTADNAEQPTLAEPPKFFFREKYAKLGVKGNFMPLAAQPANVDLADWLAHQTVENYRIVSTIGQCIQEIDHNTGKPVCNSDSCPKMLAGRWAYPMTSEEIFLTFNSHTYTWLDHKKDPIPVSAPQYISLVQRWMTGKIHDPKAFPTEIPAGSTGPNTPGGVNTDGRDWLGKSAGFPETFLHDCRTCFRQIFRIYAHLYHSHWVDPFWHLSGQNNGQGWTDLNSCFVHFCTVAKLYGLLSDRDAEPMQPLIDIWIANGSIPADAANGACAIVPPH